MHTTRAEKPRDPVPTYFGAKSGPKARALSLKSVRIRYRGTARRHETPPGMPPGLT